jgi:uncharacterized phage protein (TIGR02218 family)
VRALGASLAAHLAGRAHSRCFMLRLDLRDGTSIGITDHDKPLAFDFGTGGSLTYIARTGILTSDVTLQAGLEADNYEVTGPVSDIVTKDAILGGRLNHARAWLFQVNWRDLSQGAIELIAGNITESRIEGAKFVFEVRSDVDRFNQVVGRTIVNNCTADYGDAQCTKTPESAAGTVNAVTDAMNFAVSYGGGFADDFLNQGTVEFTSGNLQGTAPVEIFDWSAAGSIETFVPLAEAPAIGDTCTREAWLRQVARRLHGPKQRQELPRLS